MEEHLYTLLSSAVSFPVSSGVHSNDVGLPRAEMHVASGVRDMHLNGTGLVQGRIQVDVYARTKADAITAARQVQAVFEGYRGGPVQGLFLEAIRDTASDDLGYVPGRSLTFSLTYSD